jgi:hypothetical protein
LPPGTAKFKSHQEEDRSGAATETPNLYSSLDPKADKPARAERETQALVNLELEQRDGG